MNRQAERSTKDQYSLYIFQMSEELSFLWNDAQAAEGLAIKARKLSQFWEMYRFYRKQKEYLKIILNNSI